MGGDIFAGEKGGDKVAGYSQLLILSSLSADKALMGLFSNDIQVEVSADVFTFTCGAKILRLTTEVFFGPPAANGQRKVVAVGERPAGGASWTSVKIFAESAPAVGTPSKMDTLLLFFQYALASVSNQVTLVRPRVMFKHSDSLDPYFRGFQQFFLTYAMIEAGAREVIFLSPTGQIQSNASAA